VPGGSSSGSAVAVATGEADVAFGTDTGGSVRIPAACCGVAGLKTAFGRVPVKGVYPLAPSLDTVGPLGADVTALERGMRLIEPAFRVPSWDAGVTVARLRATGAEVDPAIDAAVDRALAAAGVPVTTVPSSDFRAIIDFRAALQAAGMIIDAEGFRSNAYLMPYLSQLSPHVRRNMERGARLSPADLADARRVKDEVRAALESLLSDYPVLVLPVLAGQPPLLGERGIQLTLLTVPANLAGLPALSLPLGDAGVIAAIQVIGADEERVLSFGRMIETAVTV
jgi:amidase